MTKEGLIKRYATRIEWSNNFTDLRPIINLVFECASSVLEYGEVYYNYVKYLEDDLFARGIIPFKVNSVYDLDKVQEVPGDVGRLLWYIWLAEDEYRRWKENHPRKGETNGTVNGTVNGTEELSERQWTVYEIIKQNYENNVTVNVTFLSQKLKVSRRTILRDIEVLTTKSFIRRVGSDKTGHWEPIINEKR